MKALKSVGMIVFLALCIFFVRTEVVMAGETQEPAPDSSSSSTPADSSSSSSMPADSSSSSSMPADSSSSSSMPADSSSSSSTPADSSSSSSTPTDSSSSSSTPADSSSSSSTPADSSSSSSPAPEAKDGLLLESDGLRYYVQGVMQTGWQVVDGNIYYFGEGGLAVTGEAQLDGVVQTFSAGGVLQETVMEMAATRMATLQGPAVKHYGLYLQGDQLRYGDPATGDDVFSRWITVNGSAYYIDANGNAVRGQQQVVNGVAYNFNNGYALITGLYQDFTAGGRLRYIDPATFAIKGGWLNYQNQELYYFDDKGLSVTGEQFIDGVTYNFNAGYAAYTGLYQDFRYQGRLRYLERGTFTLKRGSWYVHTNNLAYYFDQNALSAAGPQVIDGNGYNFSPTGYQLLTGLYVDNYNGGRLRYINPRDFSFKTGWYVHSNGLAYYFDQRGLSVSGPQVRIDGNGYNFSPTGFQLLTGLYVDNYNGGRLRYINPTDFSFKTGWYAHTNGCAYYFDQNGLSVSGTQVYIKGVGYNFNSGFALVTGLYADAYAGGRLRYIDPKDFSFKTGWYQHTNGLGYYFDQSGLSVTGWQKIGNVGYRFNPGFDLVTGLYADPYNGGRLRYIDSKTLAIKGGWMVVGENRYYFDGAGLSVNGVQLIDGMYFTFNDNYTLNRANILVIDVSSWQGRIDWAKVKAYGVGAAVIRALTWDNAKGYYVIDPYFEYNVRQAKANGIYVGVYLFSYAYTEGQAAEEVNFFMNSTEATRLRNEGYRFELPVFIDYEYTGPASDNGKGGILKYTHSNEQRTNILRTGMTLLDQGGYYPGFYINQNFAANYINTQQLLNEGYTLWLAHYGVTSHYWPGKADMWQYGGAPISGITGTANVDVNVLYVNYPKMTADFYARKGLVKQTMTVYNQNTGAYVTGTVQDIVSCIVENEVGGGLGLTGADKLELYKAQAVAAHSWLRYAIANGVPYPSVGLKDPGLDLQAAVAQVINMVVLYNGGFACTTYCSSSAVNTNSAADMDWGDVPYLISVASSDDNLPGGAAWRGKVNTVGMNTMRSNIQNLAENTQGLTFNPDPATWITGTQQNSAGYVTAVKVCGTWVTGGKFYDYCWGLYSPNFTYSYNPSNQLYTFTTQGNGHCVGMSQWGAAGYIAIGWSYRSVLEHYYPGTVVANL